MTFLSCFLRTSKQPYGLPDVGVGHLGHALQDKYDNQKSQKPIVQSPGIH